MIIFPVDKHNYWKKRINIGVKTNQKQRNGTFLNGLME